MKTAADGFISLDGRGPGSFNPRSAVLWRRFSGACFPRPAGLPFVRLIGSRTWRAPPASSRDRVKKLIAEAREAFTLFRDR